MCSIRRPLFNDTNCRSHPMVNFLMHDMAHFRRFLSRDLLKGFVICELNSVLCACANGQAAVEVAGLHSNALRCVPVFLAYLATLMHTYSLARQRVCQSPNVTFYVIEMSTQHISGSLACSSQYLHLSAHTRTLVIKLFHILSSCHEIANPCQYFGDFTTCLSHAGARSSATARPAEPYISRPRRPWHQQRRHHCDKEPQ